MGKCRFGVQIGAGVEMKVKKPRRLYVSSGGDGCGKAVWCVRWHRCRPAVEGITYFLRHDTGRWELLQADHDPWALRQIRGQVD